MTPRFVRLILGVLLLAYLSACGNEMRDLIQKMDSAEKKFNEAQSKEVVVFMSLETMFPDPKVRALAKAAGKGNIKKVEQLVKEGVSVNSKGTQGATPLFWAMHNYNGFKRLLELGADPNVVFGNGDGGSVVHWAVTAKDGRFLKAVLEHGGNPHLVDNQFGQTPIFAALGMNIAVVDTLLAAKADINAQNRFGNTPVLIAAGRANFEMVYHLLERGADYTIKDRHGYDLALEVALKIGRMRPESDSAKWMAKVIEWLQGKGVEAKPNTSEPSRTRQVLTLDKLNDQPRSQRPQ